MTFYWRLGAGDVRQLVRMPGAWLDHTRLSELFDLGRRLA